METPCELGPEQEGQMPKRPRPQHQRLLLTDEAVAALPYATAGDYFASDVKLSGFKCAIGKTTKLFIFQAERREGGKRRLAYKRLGDPQHVKADEARARAHEEL